MNEGRFFFAIATGHNFRALRTAERAHAFLEVTGAATAAAGDRQRRERPFLPLSVCPSGGGGGETRERQFGLGIFRGAERSEGTASKLRTMSRRRGQTAQWVGRAAEGPV